MPVQTVYNEISDQNNGDAMNNHSGQTINQISRRSFIGSGSVLLLATATKLSEVPRLFSNEVQRKINVGLITDLHYADKKPAGTRYYRQSLKKLQQAALQFKRDKPDVMVELGDLIDAADTVEAEREYLKQINSAFLALPGEKHYVLGNHCVTTLTKKEFLDGVGQEKSFYSFDSGGVHFVVLDACFNSKGQSYGRKNFHWTDSNIPVDQIDWLTTDLGATDLQAIVFVHQRLDVADNHGIKNAAAVRKVLTDSGKVLAVFQGHSHQNAHQEIGGIHYCVLKAMVEGDGVDNSGFSTLEVLEGNSLRLNGFIQQSSYQWNGRNIQPDSPAKRETGNESQ